MSGRKNTECPKKSLGKVSNAGSSLTGLRRKPDTGRPLSTVHSRCNWAGHVVILEGSPEGWTAITEQGVFINPWHNRPFSSPISCHKAVRYRLKKGHWPKSIEKRLARKAQSISFRPEVTESVP